MTDIGTRLRDERLKLELSQTEFGEAGGVHKNTQSKYEQGERAPDADYLARIAARGVDVQYVLTGVPRAEADEATAALLSNWAQMNNEDKELLLKLVCALRK
jgi:transcriptional regulator with XRE-family HTH domain